MMQKFLTTSLIVAGLAGVFFPGVVYADNREAHLSAHEGHVSALYNCDLGDKLTVYKNVEDNTYVNLRWRNKMYRMSRKETTTGAERYENPQDGLVLISIPTKSMLLDSRKGRQLANECRNPEQTRQHLAASK